MATSTFLVPNSTSPSYDLAGRSRVGNLKRIFDSSQTTVSDTQKLYSYQIINEADQESAADPATPVTPPYFAPPSVGGFIDTATTGDGCFIGVAPSGIDQNTRMLPISVDNNYEFARSIVQTKEYFLLPTGQAGLIKASGVFSPQATPINQEAFLVFRTSTSGTVDDNTLGVTRFPQSTWSENTFLASDVGTIKNRSGIVLDFTKMQCLEVEVASADGTIRLGFAVGGKIHYAHTMHTTNRIAVPLTQSYNLPIRQELSRQGTKAVSRVGYFDWKNGIFLEIQDDFLVSGLAKTWMKEHSVFSEAGEDRGTYQNDAPLVIPVAIPDDAVNYTPVLSIRPKLLFNGLENRARLFPTTISFAVSGNNPVYAAYRRGGSVTGGAWNSISPTKSWEINTTLTGINGGHDAEGIAIPAGGGSTGSQATSGTVDYLTGNFLAKVDNYVELQKPLTLILMAPAGAATLQIAVLNNSESYV